MRSSLKNDVSKYLAVELRPREINNIDLLEEEMPRD